MVAPSGPQKLEITRSSVYTSCVGEAPPRNKLVENLGIGGLTGPGMWSELLIVIPRLSCICLPQRGLILKLVALMCARKYANVEFYNKR